jgi:hypothetical protein
MPVSLSNAQDDPSLSVRDATPTTTGEGTMVRPSPTPGLIAALAALAILLGACGEEADTRSSADDETTTSTQTPGPPSRHGSSPGGWTPIPKVSPEQLADMVESAEFIARD